MNRDNIWRGVLPPAGKSIRRPERKFVLLAKDFTSVEQAVPVRLVYGRAKVAGVQIYPVFGLTTVEIRSNQGKGK